MADVVLNLIYNDNGAGKNVDNLVRSLQQMESKRYRVSLDDYNIENSFNRLKRFSDLLDSFKNKKLDAGIGFSGLSTTYNQITASISSYEKVLDSARAKLTELVGARRGLDEESELYTRISNQITSTSRDIEEYTQKLNNAKQILHDLGDGNGSVEQKVASLTAEINTQIKALVDESEALDFVTKSFSSYSNFISSITNELGGWQRDGKFGLMRNSANGVQNFVVPVTEQEIEDDLRRKESAKRMQEYDDANRQRMLNYERAQERHNNIIEQRNKEQEEFEKRQAERAKQQDEEQERRTDEQVRQEEEAARQISEAKKKLEQEEKERNERMAEGNRKYWQGLSQIITASIRLIEDSYNGLKTAMMAPLNLTGVSTVASMLESMEGSLLLNQISSNITTGFSQGVERYDILNTYPAVIEHLGYSSDEANASLNKLYQSVLGLPTAFSDIVENAQQFTLLLDDLDRATDLAIAANNAFVASGAEPGMISAGMRQIQYLLEGTKLRNTQWYSLIRSMPIALKEVGKNLGYENFTEFTAALREGNIESEILIDNLIEVGLHSENLGNILDTMKSRVTASLTNVRNAAARLGDTLLETLDKTLRSEGGKGLTENIRGVSTIIDHIGEVASKWISEHGPEIQALLDKFFNIDWASVVPGFLEGLVDVANRALDNIGTWIQDIGKIITDVRSLFNDIENSQFFVWVKNGMSIIGDIGSIFGGYALLRSGFEKGGSFGGALSSWFGSSAGTTLAAKSGFSTTAFSALGSAIGTAFVASLPVWLTTIGLSIARSMDEENDAYFEKSKQDGSLGMMVSALANDWKIAAEKVRSGDASYLYEAQAIADEIRYITRGQYDFGELTEGNINDVYWQINKLRESPFEKRISGRYQESILRAELESIGESIPTDLYEAWDKVWEGYQNRLDEVQKQADRISDKLNELREEADKWIDTTVADMAKIYGGKDGKGGKFLSEQVKEAFGGLYRNTTNDFIMTQEDAGEAMASVNDKIMEAIANMPESERAKAYEAWADYLGNFDFTDTASLAQLQQLGKETGEQLVNTFLLPRDKADEVLNENNKTTKEMREGALIAASAELDSEEEKILKEAGDNPVFSAIGQQLVDWADDMSDTYLPLIQDSLGMFSNDVVRAIQEMVNRINERRFYINPRVVYNEQPGWVSPEGYHANGGWISKGTDTVPAMLTPGEYVQRRAAVEHFGRQFMDRINALDLRGALRSISMNYATPYATGGFVRSDNRSYRDNHATVNQIFKSANASTGFRRASRFVRALG